MAGLQVTGENHKTALNLLKEIFGQKRIIINGNIENLMKIQTVYYSRANIRRVGK